MACGCAGRNRPSPLSGTGAGGYKAEVEADGHTPHGQKGEASIAKPVEVLQRLLDVNLFHVGRRMSPQVSGGLQQLLAIAGPSSTATGHPPRPGEQSGSAALPLRRGSHGRSPPRSRTLAIRSDEKDEFSSVITSRRCPVGSRRTCS